MAGFWERIFGGRSRTLALARSAELRGDLAQAADLFELGGRDDEAARVRKARALALLTASTGVPVTGERRAPMLEAAGDLEAAGEFLRAAEAYERARDVEGQARALAHAGEVDRLDELLEAEQARERQGRARRAGHEDFDVLLASGRRREAFELSQISGDAALRARGAALLARRIGGPLVRARTGDRRVTLVLGDCVVLGRAPDGEGDDAAEGSLRVGSPALSRRHLLLGRREGLPFVRDLESRHGTVVEGEVLRGDRLVGPGIDLVLGKEVACAVRPAHDWPGAVAVEVAGARYLAPLGVASAGPGRWRLSRVVAPSGPWVELVTDDAPPAFAAGLRLAPRVSLLAGDALAAEARGEVAIAFEQAAP